jgi:hypothetical protein
MKLKYLFLLGLVLLSISCTSYNNIAGYFDYKVECLGAELDGSNTLLVFSDGRNRLDATEQAKKEAVRTLLFTGVSSGKESCDLKPILLEVNASLKYEKYFNEFFKDGGEYKNYVSVSDERISNKILRDRMLGRKQIKNSVVCRVQRFKLKEKLLNDKIIR